MQWGRKVLTCTDPAQFPRRWSPACWSRSRCRPARRTRTCPRRMSQKCLITTTKCGLVNFYYWVIDKYPANLFQYRMPGIVMHYCPLSVCLVWGRGNYPAVKTFILSMLALSDEKSKHRQCPPISIIIIWPVRPWGSEGSSSNLPGDPHTPVSVQVSCKSWDRLHHLRQRFININISLQTRSISAPNDG